MLYIYTHTCIQAYTHIYIFLNVILSVPEWGFATFFFFFCHFLFKKNFKSTEKFEEVKWTFLIPFNQVHFSICFIFTNTHLFLLNHFKVCCRHGTSSLNIIPKYFSIYILRKRTYCNWTIPLSCIKIDQLFHNII